MNQKIRESIFRFCVAGFLVVPVVVLTFGCIKTYKLVPSETSQGIEREKNEEVAKNNVRSAKIYNQWETLAQFDAIWLSEQTRDSYVDLYCVRRGKGAEARESMRAREREENKETISFYVLADVRDQFHPALTDNDAAWTMYLNIKGKKVRPTSIIEVELDTEIQTLFGHRFVSPKFKTPYLVRFPARDAEGHPYLAQSVCQDSHSAHPECPSKPCEDGCIEGFKLVLSSVTKDCELGWQGGHPAKVIAVKDGERKERMLGKDEDFYWL